MITGTSHSGFKARAARGLFGRESNFAAVGEQDLADGCFWDAISERGCIKKLT
jgi:hypothetical protein